MTKMVKKFASVVMSFLMVLSVIVLPENGFSVSALTADKTYYTERGTTERFTSATADDFTATVADLVAAGYTEYSQNAIAFNGKSDTAGANNLYAVYLNADKTELKHIAFHTNTKALHITTQTLNTNDALALSEAPEYTGICDPLFIQIMPDETVVSGGTSGMSYALRMRDGRFIMIDSGMEVGDNTYQADNIYNVLNDNNVLDEITIAAWVFTHAHSDHITAFTSLVNKYYDSVNIEQLIYNYPSDEDILKDPDMAADQALSEGGIVYEQRKAIAEKLPNVKISTPYAGDLYKFPGVELEFYLTPTDMFPVMCYQGNEFNTSSLIFKIKAEGQEILITGDSADYALVNIAMPRFGTSLGSDMVQMVHHGITFASGEFYEMVGAETAFWPIISGRVSTIVKQKQNMGLINAPKTKEIILSSLGTRTITLPYTPAERDGLFVTPDGEVVDSTIYEKPTVQKYGDILDEDNTPWARSGNSYPLNNGGKYITWGSIKHNTSVTNGSDTSIYFNANSATVYTPVNGLKPNTLYTLSFDYMASSATAPSNGMFPKFGISGVNSDSPTFSYNIYQGKSKTVNPNEVYGTDNGWNHIEVNFTTDSTIYDEYYLSFLATVGAVGSSYKGYIDNISLAEAPKTYQSLKYDYENGFFGDSFPYTGISSSTSVVSEETTAPISGASSYKYQFGATGTKWALLTPKAAENKLTLGASYRVSGSYKAVQTTAGVIALYIGAASGNTKLHLTDYATAKLKIVNGISAKKIDFIGTITTVDEGYPAIYGYTQGADATNDYILLDDIVYDEIIDTVSANSADEAMGTATVTNADATFNDFAVNETAIFTATPANGSYFVGWYDEEGALVSNNDIYETVVTTDINLTAKFGIIEDFVTLTFNSNGGSEVESISGGAGLKVNMPANPTKEGYIFAGWYLNENCTENYTCKVFPESDTTLYAKWINGVYQDFENFTVSTSNPNKGEILNDFNYSYNGTHSFKAAVNSGERHRVVVAQNESEKLSAFANPGDKITISFKYKLVSGSTNFYPHTTTVASNVNALASYTTDSGSTAYANGYVYYGTNFTETSDEWQTFTDTYTLNSQSYYDELGLDAERSLGYTLLFFTAKSDNTEMYIDDVMICKTEDIPVDLNEKERTEDTVKVLAFGNSFSNDGTTFIPQIAKADGKDIRVADCSIGGCSLERHYNNMIDGSSDYTLNYRTIEGTEKFSYVSMEEALTASDWDYITIQQVSGNSGKIDTFEPYLSELVKYFKEICPNAEIRFHMTWAYEHEYSGLSKYENSQSVMYESIIDAYLQASANYDYARLIPSGEAIQRLRATDEFAEQSLNRDGFHLSDKGRLTAALVWYETFTGISALDAKFDLTTAIGTVSDTSGVNIGVTAEEDLAMRTAAHEAASLYQKANEAQKAIEAIGTVTEESGEAIEIANTLRTELNDDDLLPNLQTLIDANEAYKNFAFVAGDITGDTVVDLTDVNLLAQHLAGWDVTVNETALDINGDGLINLKDLVLLAQFVAGWDVELAKQFVNFKILWITEIPLMAVNHPKRMQTHFIPL